MTAKNSSTRRDLAILISVPLALAALLAAVVYIPQLLARPSHDFIYTTCSSYMCDKTVNVIDGTISVTARAINERSSYTSDETMKMYYYDVSEESSRPLTTEEAQTYRLDSSSRSPDGYVLSRQTSSSSGFLFWSSGTGRGWMLKNGMFKKNIDLSTQDGYYDSSVKFIGWVK